jgi:cobalt-zinc-cadmium efflux system outer membrane protein
MSCHPRWLAWAALCCVSVPWCRAQEWSEADIIERFQSLSPQVRELRARVAVVEADARTRTVYPNPFVSYSREGAGYAEFIEASQTLPWNGRLRYLRDAGHAAVGAANAAREALLWSWRSDLRVAFYRMVGSQERVQLLSRSIGEVEQLARMLRQREDEGEGSRYDRVRAARELTELRTDLRSAQSLVAAAGARLAGFLPEGTAVPRVTGRLSLAAEAPELEELVRRALATRADYRASQRNLARDEAEEQAARRLRIPEPVVTAGVKRGNVPSGLPPNPFSDATRTALAFSVSVPILAFNRGQYEVARFQAEQEQVQAQMAGLARRIRTEVQGARDVLSLRQEALAAYQRELDSAGSELTQITQVAYEEGEIGILELLDALRLSRAASLRLLDLQAGVKEAGIELERVVGEEVHP